MKTITLFIDGAGWMARDSDPETKALFGTDTLPLPFLKNVKAEAVRAVIQELNPDATVEVVR